MTKPIAPASSRRRQRTALIMLAIGGTLNYLDRSNGCVVPHPRHNAEINLEEAETCHRFEHAVAPCWWLPSLFHTFSRSTREASGWETTQELDPPLQTAGMSTRKQQDILIGCA
jgi:hypothetical protein